MTVAVFSDRLSSFGADRARALHERGVVSDVYAYAGPPSPSSLANREEWAPFRAKYRGRLWGWYVCSRNQQTDVDLLHLANALLRPDGWILDVEQVLERRRLRELVAGVSTLGVPVRATLAGVSAAHTWFDYRELDLAGVDVSWQAYFDSGEGPPPDVAVAELYRCSFVVDGWQYRHRVGPRYGWGQVTEPPAPGFAGFDSYLEPGPPRLRFRTLPREWGRTVVSGELLRDNLVRAGWLMGRAAYPRIRVTLDTTRGAGAAHTLTEWQRIAGSARVPGAARRPVDVYLAESSSDAVLAAIAAGYRFG